MVVDSPLHGRHLADDNFVETDGTILYNVLNIENIMLLQIMFLLNNYAYYNKQFQDIEKLAKKCVIEYFIINVIIILILYI